MDKSSRAMRRHHRARMYKRAKKILDQWYWFDPRSCSFTKEEEHRIISLRRDHITLCSCEMCRNVRRSGWTSGKEYLTLQERRNLDNYKDGLKETEDVCINEE